MYDVLTSKEKIISLMKSLTLNFTMRLIFYLQYIAESKNFNTQKKKKLYAKKK